MYISCTYLHFSHWLLHGTAAVLITECWYTSAVYDAEPQIEAKAGLHSSH